MSLGSLIPISSCSKAYPTRLVRYSVSDDDVEGETYLNIELFQSKHVVEQIQELCRRRKLPHSADLVEDGLLGVIGHRWKESGAATPSIFAISTCWGGETKQRGAQALV